MSNYDQLKKVLNEIFELDKADLDFGIYRIMNQKRKQVNEFIDKQLPADIKMALSETQTADKAELESELKTLKKNLEAAGVVAEETPKYKLLNEKLSLIDNTEVLEQEVFSHLANFFRRYIWPISSAGITRMAILYPCAATKKTFTPYLTRVRK